MGRDYPTIALLARRRAGGGPVLAIALQAAISIAMVLTASFDELLTYIGFSYRTWGHPFTSIGFVLLSVWMVAFAFLERPLISLAGFGTIALGVVVWWVLERRRSR